MCLNTMILAWVHSLLCKDRGTMCLNTMILAWEHSLLCKGRRTMCLNAMILASEHSHRCKDRRTMRLNTMVDTQGKQVIEKLPLSPTLLLSGDVEGVATAIKHWRDIRGAYSNKGRLDAPSICRHKGQPRTTYCREPMPPAA
ncbi:hypothetical protein ACOMHN_049084 [Nucella lapillus]